jgi:cytochrome c oxidase subunit 3
MRELRPEVQYRTLAQQGETAELGMWVFLATEVLFFGALFFAYFVYRTAYPDQFSLAARDSKILLGSINTALLLTSSLTMVAAIGRVKQDRGGAAALLFLTAVLGIAFLGVKAYEYVQDYEDQTVPVLNFVLKSGHQPPTQLFWIFYFVATGVHAVHLSIGIAFVLIMTLKTRRGAFSPSYYAPLEVVGLYWSFVDVVWLFLFAAIYPVARSAS